GPFTIIDHLGGDVLAVPDAPYSDTTGKPGVAYWYAVAALADTKSPPGRLSLPVQACSRPEPAETMLMTVKTQTSAGQLPPIWYGVGSEQLSVVFHTAGPGGSQIGTEFAEALRLAHAELGTQYIRAHAILNDDLGVYRQTNGETFYNFEKIDNIYDRLL